jgi:hypothetical protein
VVNIHVVPPWLDNQEMLTASVIQREVGVSKMLQQPKLQLTKFIGVVWVNTFIFVEIANEEAVAVEDS